MACTVRHRQWSRSSQIAGSFRRRTEAVSCHAFPTWFLTLAPNGWRREGSRDKARWLSLTGSAKLSGEPMTEETMTAGAFLATLSTPTTCKLRSETTSAALSAARETHLAAVACEAEA